MVLMLLASWGLGQQRDEDRSHGRFKCQKSLRNRSVG